MNRLQYRIVFNKQRGQLMAVAETALSHVKGGSAGESNGPAARAPADAGSMPAVSRGPPSLLALAAACAMGAVITLAPDALAQVKADPNAPKHQQPTVVNSANGTVQVNIQTPSAAGVSRNSYSQFDVDKRGVILNNSRTDVSTQLGGYVQANPWLAAGSARVILNEVNSSAPSQLKGYVEVAGQRAEVVIANPSGIQVDGAGFINASAAVLTTGTPRFSADGRIAGYGVQGGLIRVDGQGLDGSSTDYTALLARAVEINAGIWAKDVRIQTGSQVMTVDETGVAGGEPLAPTGERPRYALDSTALGGIYAQRITLVGTEAGLGVRQAGQVVGGQLTLRADGWLDNTGTVYAQEADANGTPALTVQSNAGVLNSGWLASRGSTDLRAPQLTGETGSVTAAGMAADGTIVAGGGSLSLTAAQSAKQAGQLLAADRLAVQAPTIDLGGAQAQAASIGLGGDIVAAREALLIAGNGTEATGTTSVDLTRAHVQAGTIAASAPTLIADGAQLSATGTLSLKAAGTLSTQAASLASGKLAITAHDADLRQAEWLQVGTDALSLRVGGTMTADGARIASNGASLSIAANAFSAIGASLEQYGSGALSIDGASVNLNGATLWSNGALSATAAQLTLDGADLQARAIALKANGTLSQQRATLRTTGTATLSADRIDNRGARVAADGGLTIQAGAELRNDRGELQSASGGIAIVGQSDIANAAGLIAARDGVSVQGRSLVQEQGAAIGGQDVTLKLQGELRQDASSTLSATNGLGIEARAISAEGQLRAGGALTLSALENLALGGSVYGGQVTASSGGDLSVAGLLAAQGSLSATAAQRLQTGQGATIAAGLGADGRLGGPGALAMTAGSAMTLRGQVLAVEARLEAAGLDLTGSQIQAINALGLKSGSELLTEGAQLSASTLSLQAQDWRHAGGQLALSGSGDLIVALTGRLDNRQGVIQTNAKSVSLTAQTIDNTAGKIATGGDALALHAQSLANQGGTLTTSGDLTVEARQLDNRDGELSGRRVALASQQLDNTGRGLIRATGAVSIDADTLTHTGTIAAGEALGVRAGVIDSSGTFAAGLRADNTIGASGDLTLTAARTLQHAGTTLAGGVARLDGGELQLQGSQTQAAGVVAQAHGGELRLDRAVMVAADGLNLRTGAALVTDNAQVSGGTVTVSAADWRNAGGAIAQTAAIGGLTASVNGTLDNTGGRIAGNGAALSLSAQRIDNVLGQVIHAGGASGELRLDATTLHGADGTIAGAGGLTLNVAAHADLGGAQALTQADRVAITAGSLSTREAKLIAQHAAQLSVSGALDNTAGLVQSGGPLTVQAATLTNRDGQIGGAGVTLNGGAVDNAGQGLISSTSSLTVAVDRLSNAGQLQAAGDLSAAVRDVLDNTGLIVSQGDARVRAETLHHTGTLAARGNVLVAVGTIDSTGTFAAGLKNDNTVDDRGDLTLTARDATHSGLSLAGGSFSLAADRAALQGSRTQAWTVSLQALAGDLGLAQGTVAATRSLSLSASGTLDTSAAALSGGSVAIAAAGWRHAAGSLAQTDAVGAFRADVAGTIDNQGGRIGANAQSVSLNAGILDNRGGDITHASTGALSVTATTLAGTAGRIASAGDVTLDVSGAATLDRAWTQGRDIAVAAGSLNHREGQLVSDGQTALSVGGALDNTGGLLQSTQALTMHAGSLDNTAGRIDGRAVQLRTDGLLNNGADDARGARGANGVDGVITAAQSLRIDAARLDNAGAMQSSGDATLNVGGAFINTGSVYGQGAVSVVAGGALTHGGMIAAQGDLTVRADSIASAGAFAAGLRPDNTMGASGDLTISSAGTLQHSGTAQAAGRASLDGAALLLQDSQTSAASVALTARCGELRLDRALLSVSGLLDLHSSTTLNTEGSRMSGASVAVTAVDWRHAGGQIGQTDAAGSFTAAVTGLLDNQGGRIAGNGASLALSAATLDNAAGQIVHAGGVTGELRIDATSLSGSTGTIDANGGLTLNVTGAADLTGAKTQADRVAVTAGSLNNRGGELLSQHAARLAIAGELDNTSGLLQAGGSLAIDAGMLTNRDGQIGASDVALTGASVVNAGQGLIAAQGRLSADVASLSNAGTMQAGGDVDVRASGSLLNSGSIRAQGDALVRADVLTHSGTVTAQGAVTVNAREIASTGAFAAGLNADNTLGARGDLTLTASGALQHSGTALAGGSLTLSGAGLALQDSRVQAQRVTMSALTGDVRLDRAVANGGDRLTLTAAGALDTSGATLGAGSVGITATDWRNVAGDIAQSATAGELRVDVSGTLNNQGGSIAANATDVTLNTQALDNRQGTLLHAGTGTLMLDAQQIDGSDGEILGKGALRVLAQGAVTLDGALTQARGIDLQAGSLSHRDGQLLSQAGATLSVGGGVNNAGGLIQSAEDLRVSAGSIDNTGGQIDGRGVHLSTTGRLNNGAQGLIASVQALAIEAGRLDNAGLLQSQAAADLTVHGAFANAGTAYARGPMTITTSGLLGNTGMLAAQGALTAQAGSIASTGGFVAGLNPDNTLGTQGDLTLRSTGALQQSGQTLAAGAMSLSGAALQLQDARLQAQTVGLTATGGDLQLNRATLASSGALTLTSAGALDTGAATVSGAGIAVTAQRWSNVDGSVTQTAQTGQGAAFSATLQGALDNTRGEIAAAGRTLTIAAGAMDNTQGRVVHAGADGMRIDAASLSGVGGEILGAHAVTLAVTGAVDLSQAKTQGAQLTIEAGSLRHRGGELLSAGDAQLRVTGALDNTGGAIVAGGDLRAQANAIDNTGGQIGARAVDLTVGTLTNGAQGLINAQGALTVGASQLNNAGALQSGADTRLIVTGDLNNSGAVYTQGNAVLNVGNALGNTGSLGAQGALTIDAASLSGTGSLAAGLRPDNTLAAQGELTVRTTGSLQSSGAMLSAGRLTVSGRELQLQDSRLQAAAASLTSSNGPLRLDRAALASAGDLMLASAGLLSTDGATLSGANVGLTAGDWRNVGGSLTQLGSAGQLSATIGGQITNTDGRIQAVGSLLRLQAQAIDNVRGALVQAGSGPLTLSTGTLSGANGQILSNGALTVGATGAVTLTHAQTQGAGVTVTGSSLDHRGANLVSTGTAQLTIDGAIDNTGGTLASAGALDVRAASLANGGNGLLQSDSTLQATVGGTLDNQGGRLRSGSTMSLSAGAVDNRGGSVGSDGALTVTTGGALLNASGNLLALQGVTLTAASVGNQQGRIASLQGGVTVRAQGALDNTQGAIQAAQTADLLSTSLTNRQGEVSGTTVAIDTRGQTLDNTGGRLLASQSLTTDSGTLENRGGLLQSLGALSVQTHGAALNNTRDAAVTTPTGLHAQGAMTINAGALSNENGISAGTTAQLSVSQLTNRAELSASSLGLAVGGTLDNQGGRVVGTQSLNASAQQVLNQGGLIYGGNTLTLSAAGRVDNTNTSGSGQGIQGGNVTVQAQQLDNIGGQVLASGNLGLTITQALNNAGGALGSSGTQTIGDGALASALSLNNAGGRIWSGDAMGLNLRELAGGVGGQISSGAGMTVKLAGDFSYGAGSQFQAAGNLSLDLSGNFSNQGTLRSGGALSIQAASIDNAASGELSGAQTFLTAAGQLTNRGLIDGDGVWLTADRIVNLGTGRIYGGDVIIDGGQLVNGAEGGVSAVIAGRRTIDAVLTRDIANTGGALIFADGTLTMSGASLLNENSTIEASSALGLNMTGGIVNRTVLAGVSTGQVAGTGSGGTGGGSSGGGGKPGNGELTETPPEETSGGNEVAPGTGSGSVSFLETKAFIRSGGNMSLTGATLLNSGANIEARGNLLLQAGTIDNLNPYLAWQTNPNAGAPSSLRIDYSPSTGIYEEYTTTIQLNGRTADQALRDWQNTHRNMRVTQSVEIGGGDPATVTQSLAANIIVGGQLTVLGATSIRNDMSRVVGYTGVAITGGQVNNVEHKVDVVDAQGVTRQATLVLPAQSQSFIPDAQGAGGRQQAGGVSTGGGASQQSSSGFGQATAGGGSGLSGLINRVMQQVNQGGAAQTGAQANAQWRSGGQVVAEAVDAGNAAGGAGAVNAGLRAGVNGAAKAVNAAQSGDAGASVRAGTQQTRDGDFVQAGGAQNVSGAQLTTQWRDGDAASAQNVQKSEATGFQPGVQGNARQGLSAISQALRAAAAAQLDGSAPDSKATTQIDKVQTATATSSQHPGATQGVSLRGSGATFNGKPLALSVRVNLTPPSNSLFKTHKEPTSKYLVETDPRFANYRDWLSSDFLLEAMALDPTVTQKRLGDGFYEQRLVREQIGQLTGTGYLSGYADDESQYRALLTNGATFAKAHQLVPGVALTAEQMSQLTSDLVWLVEQTVTLADGTTQRVLVPQVYLVPREGDLLPSGSLIAGGRVEMALSGDFTNGGDVRGGAVNITAQNISNSGDMRGTTLALSAREDLRNIGGSLNATGDMILVAGRDIAMETTIASGGTQRGNVTTKATVLDQVASLSAGGVMVVQAGRDVTLQAVQITQGGADGAGADGGVLIQAGRDLALTTVTTASARDETKNANNYKKESQHQDVGTALQAEGAIVLKAGQDLTATASQIASAQGEVTLGAGRDVQLLAGEANSVVEEMTQKTKKSLFKKKITTTYSKTDQTAVVGTSLTGDTVTVLAGQDIRTEGATIKSNGLTLLDAKRDLVLDDAMQSQSTTDFSQTVKKTTGLGAVLSLGTPLLFSNLNALQDATKTVNEAVGTTVSAGSVIARAGRDASLQGATVVADGDVFMSAGRNLTLTTAETTEAGSSSSSSKKSGFIGSWWQPAVGAVKTSTAGAQQSTTQTGSQLASLGGNVTLAAGEIYTQTGSSVIAQADKTGVGGNVDIEGKKVVIEAAVDSANSTQTSKFSKTALGGTVSIPIVNAVQSTLSAAKSATKTEDTRMQALAGMNAALSGMDAVAAAGQVAGNPMGGIKVGVSLGTSKSQSTSTEQSTMVSGSQVAGQGDVSIRAIGDGQGSTLQVVGSDIKAGGRTTLKADGAIDLEAARNTQTLHSTNSNSGASIGVSYAMGGSQNGFTLELAANKGKGKADGDGNNAVQTHVSGDQVRIESGGDTTLKGAVVQSGQVSVSIGGNLNIESIQDVATYSAKQQSASVGVSLCIPPFCYGASSVSGSFSSAQAKGNFASVIEQSGIAAGDGGFQLNVKGNTDLKGGLIASTQQAIDDKKNSLVTGSLTQSDIENSDSYKASGFSVSGSYSGKVGDQSTAKTDADKEAAKSKTGKSAAPGIGSVSGSQASTTKSGVSGAEITITDEAKQKELTAQDAATAVAGLNRDVSSEKDNSGALKKAWDGQSLMDEVQTQVQITQQALPRIANEIGTLMDRKYDELMKTDPVEAAKYAEGGAYRVAAHAALGALGGGLAAGVGAGASAYLTPDIAKAVKGIGLPAAVSDLVTAAAATAVGAITGGGAGTATAGNQVVNNYLSHQQVQTLTERLEECGSNEQCRSDAMQWAYLQSTINDKMLLNCKSTNNCDDLVKEFRKGAQEIDRQFDLGAKSSDVEQMMLLENNARTILQNKLQEKVCETAECKERSEFLVGVGKGVSKITPAGLVVGVGVGTYGLTSLVLEKGGEEAAIAVVKGVAGLPRAIYEGLNSEDPRIRGEALVDALAIGAVATTVTAKLAPKVVTTTKDAISGMLATDFRGAANVAIKSEDVVNLIKEHSQNGQNPLTEEALNAMLRQAQPEGTVVQIPSKAKGSNQVGNADLEAVFPSGQTLALEIKTVANQNSFNAAIRDGFQITAKNGNPGKASDIVTIQVPAGTTSGTARGWLEGFWTSSSGKALSGNGFEFGSVVVVDPAGKVLIPLKLIKPGK